MDKLKWNILFIRSNKKNQYTIIPISIGVTTFMDRYENCLVPLLRKLSYLFPDNEIIIIANGHVLKKEQDVYLENLTNFCSSFPHVKLYKHQLPQGLSAMWNQIIRNSKNNNILMLNDDVDVKVNFDSYIEQLLQANHEFLTINESWSHFIISKSIFEKVGMFDEGLLEIGGEDDDYAARLAINNISIHTDETTTIKCKLNLNQKRPKINSYGWRVLVIAPIIIIIWQKNGL
ncbi:MAG: hypothetical protein NTW16_09695 [Bacteroidetes bacterium]|nr:hypothetical protein [Bacteroidota bacterium]